MEQTLDLSEVSSAPSAEPSEDAEPLVERKTTVEVNGKRFDVKMWVPKRLALLRTPSARSLDVQPEVVPEAAAVTARSPFHAGNDREDRG